MSTLRRWGREVDKMTDTYDSRAVMLLTVLQEPNADKAREQYCKAFEIDEIKDQAIYDLIEDRVFDAILRTESIVEIDIDIAPVMLLLLKNGIKRSKGGQRNTRHQERRMRALVQLGRQIKAELQDEGKDATQARLEAAEKVAEAINRYDYVLTAGYLAREMQRTDR
jgi:hypothetical protein